MSLWEGIMSQKFLQSTLWLFFLLISLEVRDEFGLFCHLMNINSVKVPTMHAVRFQWNFCFRKSVYLCTELQSRPRFLKYIFFFPNLLSILCVALLLHIGSKVALVKQGLITPRQEHCVLGNLIGSRDPSIKLPFLWARMECAHF